MARVLVTTAIQIDIFYIKLTTLASAILSGSVFKKTYFDRLHVKCRKCHDSAITLTVDSGILKSDISIIGHLFTRAFSNGSLTLSLRALRHPLLKKYLA